MQCAEHPEICFKTTVAETFPKRLIGLLHTRVAPAPGTGLLLRPGGSVHTFGMREAIEVIHLDHHLRVIGQYMLQPWRFGLAPRKTFATLEIACHQISTSIIGCHFREKTSCQLNSFCGKRSA